MHRKNRRDEGSSCSPRMVQYTPPPSGNDTNQTDGDTDADLDEDFDTGDGQDEFGAIRSMSAAGKSATDARADESAPPGLRRHENLREAAGSLRVETRPGRLNSTESVVPRSSFGEISAGDERGSGRQNGAIGVDLNRNWPFMWAMDDDGSSNETCSEVYRGPSAGSEKEVQ